MAPQGEDPLNLKPNFDATTVMLMTDGVDQPYLASTENSSFGISMLAKKTARCKPNSAKQNKSSQSESNTNKPHQEGRKKTHQKDKCGPNKGKGSKFSTFQKDIHESSSPMEKESNMVTKTLTTPNHPFSKLDTWLFLPATNLLLGLRVTFILMNLHNLI